MPDIPGFWKGGPHKTIAIEPSWREFVISVDGIVVEDLLPKERPFENADFIFSTASVVVELKEIETEFTTAPAFRAGFDKLMQKVVEEDPLWRPALFGGSTQTPAWFGREFVRLFRPPLSRILKKANRQLRQTKAHFNITTPSGVLLLVNDGFTAMGPNPIRALTSELLLHSYSSIDCCVYLTVNRYIEIAGSDEPKLLWAPTYSDRASDTLVEFVNKLGAQWFDYLERKIGPFTSRAEVPNEGALLQGARAIVPPNERG